MARPAGIEPATVGLEIGAAGSERVADAGLMTSVGIAPANASALTGNAARNVADVQALGESLAELSPEEQRRVLAHLAALVAMPAKRRATIVALTEACD
jgi:Lon protease-like protein